MTDRTRVNIVNPKIACANCLNDDPWDTCVQCSEHDLFLGLKQDKRTKSGYRVLKTKSCEIEGTTPEDLLERIKIEKEMKGQAMFGGRSLETVYGD